jgi:bifunctional non-homologous end joining protein LigD
LLWKEVQQNVSPTDFHLLNIEERLQRMGDLLKKVPPQPVKQLIAKLP